MSRAALDGALYPALITAAATAAGTSLHRKEGGPSLQDPIARPASSTRDR
jgi:hypothetical protein